MSRAQVANSLGSKDPSWVRQTPDRGLDSPAYRKSDERSNSQVDLGMGLRLPGMSRESTAEPETEVLDVKSLSPPHTASTFDESIFSNRHSNVSSATPTTGLGSPLDAPKLVPSPTEALVDEPMPPSPTQRRMSPERARSTSPTKGLGGFVQSAMMKRSDSVTKRWSAQIPQGVSRGNSSISNRNSVAAPSLTGSVSDLTSSTSASRLNRDTSPEPTQRPSSSFSEATVQPSESMERPKTPSRNTGSMRSDGSPGRPALYGHARSMTAESQGTDGSSSPLTSRTMDPKRWSPTKASWLESALNRPESRQRQSPQQLSWASQRQSKGSLDGGRVNSFKEVTPVGLMRTPPPGGHFKKPSVSDTRSIYGSPGTSKKELLAESPLPAVEPETSTKPEPLKEETTTSDPVAPELETIESLGEGQDNSENPEPSPNSVRKTPPVVSAKPNFSLPSREPLSPKPKSETPVIDFRANLRKREAVKDAGPGEEPEFKNVFGKLKKTETRNYVAPDELKHNILRGKAALNTTGGPQKTQRVDEFRESILKRKDAMKAGGGSIRRNAAEEKDAPEPEVPEAIAKRNRMSKTASIGRSPAVEQTSTGPKEAATTQSLDQPSLSSSAIGQKAEQEIQDLSSVAKEPQAEPDLQPTPGKEQDTDDVAEATAMEVERRPSNESASAVRGLPSARRAQAANTTAVPPSMPAKGKLAGRINPALAGILSRGPPSTSEGPKKELAASPMEDAPAKPSAPLTHMTKCRARGPRRRLPTGDAAPAVSSAQDTEVGAISSSEVQPFQKPPTPTASSNPRPASPPKDSLAMDAEQARTESLVIEELPPVNTSFQDAQKSGLQQRVRNMSPISPSGSVASDKENTTRDVKSPDADSPSNRPPVPPKPSSSPSQSPSSPPAPVKPRWTQQGRYASTSPSPLRSNFNENGPFTPTKTPIPGVMVADSSPRNKSLPSPPVPSKGDITLTKPADHRLSRKMSAPSLVAQAAEAREVISGFFKTFPDARDRVDIDPQLMLTSQTEEAIRTVKRQIWEVTVDGKRQELPTTREYVLYEGSMYVCEHLFEGRNGNSSKVYLWRGDDVPQATLDYFEPRVCRAHGGTLTVIRQGSEPEQFIKALGGIIITRRGSSSRHTSSALYMLCGRKHMGQMAFDEVDYSLRSLCSGFPFVVSAPFGKLYLWKGKGSSPEEIGAARLISMDLGLTGEFEEVEEGQEPEGFFDIFPRSNETNPLMTSEYWELKPKYSHYRTRLFRVDHHLGQSASILRRVTDQLGQSTWVTRTLRPGQVSPTTPPNDCVQEIEPFCYKALTETDVYVLDTFFEIWV